MQFPPEGQGRQKWFLERAVQWRNIGNVWIGPFVALVICVSPDYIKAVLANIGKLLFTKVRGTRVYKKGTRVKGWVIQCMKILQQVNIRTSIKKKTNQI